MKNILSHIFRKYFFKVSDKVQHRLDHHVAKAKAEWLPSVECPWNPLTLYMDIVWLEYVKERVAFVHGQCPERPQTLSMDAMDILQE